MKPIILKNKNIGYYFMRGNVRGTGICLTCWWVGKGNCHCEKQNIESLGKKKIAELFQKIDIKSRKYVYEKCYKPYRNVINFDLLKSKEKHIANLIGINSSIYENNINFIKKLLEEKILKNSTFTDIEIYEIYDSYLKNQLEKWRNKK